MMNELYNRKLSWIDVSTAKADLIEIEQKLLKYSQQYVVWDIDDLSKAPPWGDKINPQIKSLANYFTAANGRTFFEVMCVAMDVAKEDKCDIKLRHI
ncbi:Imm70 family immunity protein [Metabacillus fastidiosus]|uniref:Imm70 family immunity protein n=1 Tax=Metabacillus fastidiosus TaxID=1458 RepID=UPI00350E46E8